MWTLRPVDRYSLTEPLQADLEQEKGAKQRAIGEFRALPTKLGLLTSNSYGKDLTDGHAAQQETMRATFQQGMSEIRQRILDNSAEYDKATMVKAQIALDYAVRST